MEEITENRPDLAVARARHENHAAAEIRDSGHAALMADDIAGTVEQIEHFVGVGQGEHQRSITPNAFVRKSHAPSHAPFAFSESRRNRAIGVDEGFCQKAHGLLIPNSLPHRVGYLHEVEDIVLLKTTGEVPAGGRVRNALGAQTIEESLIIAVAQEHYLGKTPPVGDFLRQVVERGGRAMALLAWGSAALKLKDREQWIGWSASQRAERLKVVVQNRRYLLLHARGENPNLASQALAAACRALPAQWQERFGYRVLLAETFTDPETYAGTSYKASGWEPVGLSEGNSRHRCDSNTSRQSRFSSQSSAFVDAPPEKPYKIIGMVSVLGGAHFLTSDTDVYRKLQKSAAALGADAVITSLTEDGFYNRGEGKAIKYQ